MVALTVDVKSTSTSSQRVLRRVHVGVAEARVVSVRCWPVEDCGQDGSSSEVGPLSPPWPRLRSRLLAGPELARGERGAVGGSEARRCAPAVEGGGGRLRIVFSGEQESWEGKGEQIFFFFLINLCGVVYKREEEEEKNSVCH